MSVWLKALQLVPWDDVIKSTPGLVRQARQLFRSSKKAREGGEAATPVAAPLDARDPHAVAAAIQALQQRVHQLEEEQRQSAALLESLAEQHEMVVATLGALRARAKLLTVTSGVLVLAVVGLLTWVSRH